HRERLTRVARWWLTARHAGVRVRRGRVDRSRVGALCRTPGRTPARARTGRLVRHDSTGARDIATREPVPAVHPPGGRPTLRRCLRRGRRRVTGPAERRVPGPAGLTRLDGAGVHGARHDVRRSRPHDRPVGVDTAMAVFGLPHPVFLNDAPGPTPHAPVDPDPDRDPGTDHVDFRPLPISCPDEATRAVGAALAEVYAREMP